MKNESKFYNEIKKNINQISWIRLENSVLHGVADLLAYNVNGTFFTVELKVARGNKITFSPHQIAFHFKHSKNTFILVKGQGSRSPKLFEGSRVHELLNVGYKSRALAQGYDEIKKVLCSL
jgi:Holliday junction resolvase